ncbi:MAG: fumarylacetoacetate hydrolase family protein [Rubellimicrobium sp.]|nr:fumarylacetoacetate hydrolase family protein [Rubellimicrobium sp.]
MRLCRLRKDGGISPAALVGDHLHDLSGLVRDIDPGFFAAGGPDRLRGHDLAALPRIAAHDGFAPAVALPSKIVCIGLNYHDHAAEAKMAVPDEPVVFLKAPSALSGANDPIPLPPGAGMLDWEVELACVIGRRTQRADRGGALACVAGYAVLNDISERSFQLHRGGQWTKGKSHDGFAPFGPYLVTDVPDPHALRLSLAVNGEVMQDGTTADLIFDLPAVIAHVSSFMSLEPGDIIATGTPAGVGFGRVPQRFLAAGDRVRAEIAGLGVQEQVVRAET